MEQPWTVELYETPEGDTPVLDFIHGSGAAAKLTWELDALEQLGFERGGGKIRPITGVRKLYELRVRYQKQFYRLFFFPAPGRRLMVVHGMVKKTKKTPKSEIRRAERRMVEYLGRR
ncbi:MAG: type II toxin-antitoxin system RelE/ParE family toxin [Anaerolineae bacterium]